MGVGRPQSMTGVAVPPTPPCQVRAVVVYPFDPSQVQSLKDEEEGQWALRLSVGDVVVLDEEDDEAGWYLGHLVHNPGLVGVFPKSYVHRLWDPLRPDHRHVARRRPSWRRSRPLCASGTDI